MCLKVLVTAVHPPPTVLGVTRGVRLGWCPLLGVRREGGVTLLSGSLVSGVRRGGVTLGIAGVGVRRQCRLHVLLHLREIVVTDIPVKARDRVEYLDY